MATVAPRRQLLVIGVGVTTFRRPKMLAMFQENLHAYTNQYHLEIVDDSETELGVAASKNKCIARLMEAEHDHVFLFDDDCWPCSPDWWQQYTESGMNHLSWNWMPEWDQHRELWPVEDNDALTGWNTSNGCMLYYTREALETAGGMRLQFGKWGFEHLEHSRRIYNFGLTPEPFISLSNQFGIYATDQHDEQFKTNSSSITTTERQYWYDRNRDLYRYWCDQEPRFVPWA